VKTGEINSYSQNEKKKKSESKDGNKDQPIDSSASVNYMPAAELPLDIINNNAVEKETGILKKPNLKKLNLYPDIMSPPDQTDEPSETDPLQPTDDGEIVRQMLAPDNAGDKTKKKLSLNNKSKSVDNNSSGSRTPSIGKKFIR